MAKKKEKRKLTIKRPEVHFEKKSLVVFAIAGVLSGILISVVVSALTLDYRIGGIAGLAGGALFGIITNTTRKTLLKDVQYPSLKKLLELVIYTLVICIIISIIILGLDVLFVRVRDIIL